MIENGLFLVSLLMVGLALARPIIHLLRPVEQFLHHLGSRPPLAFVSLSAFSFAVCALLSEIGPLPAPRIHDEFSYLLAGNTFVHGRLTNPTPRFWEHFESMHIMLVPSYASKYPPGQGLALAIGMVLARQAIVGVWLSSALAVGLTYWMLAGWTRPMWAVLGAGLLAIHPTFLVWSQGYWGGAVALAGGSLFLGAIARLARQLTAGQAIALAGGLAILANSRPY